MIGHGKGFNLKRSWSNDLTVSHLDRGLGRSDQQQSDRRLNKLEFLCKYVTFTYRNGEHSQI